ncbi:MAG: DMT family transporter [Bacteroidales bacterium]|nr:DMT family transporter [Bacteroidales bacterium]
MKDLVRYFPAVITAIVWGSTFVASKHVLVSGVSPFMLMTFRFVVAYLSLWLFCRKWLPLAFNRREFLFLLLGVSGGSLYFLFEYFSLKHTSAVNVGLISALVPILSTLIAITLRKVSVTFIYVFGSLLALFGVYLVVTDGNFVFEVYPLGDILAFGAALLWAIYTVVLNLIGPDVDPLLVSRRLFFYAIITILPFTCILSEPSEIQLFADTSVLLPAFYLAFVASALCIWLWNVSINLIGLVKTNNFLYFLPVVSLASSAIFFADEVSLATVVGSACVFVGVVIADRVR